MGSEISPRHLNMNRKKKAKLEKKVEAYTATLSVFDDPLQWLNHDAVCPWTPKQIEDYQKKLDSAFGAENAIVIAWSYDERYFD